MPESATTEKLITSDELLQHPEWGRCELIDGKVNFMSPAGAQHGKIAIIIGARILDYVGRNDAGEVFGAETGFLLFRNPDTVRAPDVMFLSKARIPAGGIPKSYLPVAPDLAVEVVSPTDLFSDVISKAQSFIAAGVRVVWIVDPQTNLAHVCRPGGAMVTLSAPKSLTAEEVLPGFALPLCDVFAA